MNILYIYAHPNPASFNAMLKNTALDVFNKAGIHVELSDLYADKFKAIADWDDFNTTPQQQESQYFLAQQSTYQNGKLSSDIMREIDKVSRADHIILQFPLWWFSTPAILKGWLDRVLVKGFAYDTGKIFNDGLLKGKKAVLVVSTQSPESAYQSAGVHHATIDVFIHPIHHTLRFAGIDTLAPFVTYGAFNLEETRTKKIAQDYQDYLLSHV